MIYVCKNCNYTFWVKRARCPKCSSSEFNEIKVNEGDVIQSWRLNATPDGFENSYFLLLVKVGSAKVFCRSLEHPRSNKVTIDENGLCREIN